MADPPRFSKSVLVIENSPNYEKQRRGQINAEQVTGHHLYGKENTKCMCIHYK
jgi:hypothetical protein